MLQNKYLEWHRLGTKQEWIQPPLMVGERYVWACTSIVKHVLMLSIEHFNLKNQLKMWFGKTCGNHRPTRFWLTINRWKAYSLYKCKYLIFIHTASIELQWKSDCVYPASGIGGLSIGWFSLNTCEKPHKFQILPYTIWKHDFEYIFICHHWFNDKIMADNSDRMTIHCKRKWLSNYQVLLL